MNRSFRVLLFAAVVGFGFLAAALFLKINGSTPSPSLQVVFRPELRGEERHSRDILHDFGVISPGSKQRFEVRVRNDTAFNWRLAGIQTECSCTVAHVASRITKSGEYLEADIDFTSPNDVGDVKKLVTFYFADDMPDPIVCALTACMREKISILPREIRLKYSASPRPRDNSVEFGENSAALIMNYSTADWDDVVVISHPARTSLQISRLTLKEINEHDHSGLLRQCWRVQIEPNLKVGETLDKVSEVKFRVVQGDNSQEASIRVNSELVHAISASPSRLFFGRVDRSTNPPSRRTVIRFADSATPALEDISVKSDLESVLRVAVAKGPNGVYFLDATLNALSTSRQTDTRFVTGNVEITWMSRPETLSLPVSIAIP